MNQTPNNLSLSAAAGVSGGFRPLKILQKRNSNASKPNFGRFYRPELDALRFIAFFAVYIHHAIYVQLVPSLAGRRSLVVDVIRDFQNTCAFGVCLFFLLSAYLITTLILKEVDQTGSLSLKFFYVRRILRIWPLYFFIIGVALIAGIVWPSQTLTLGHVAWLSLLMGNFYTVLFGMAPNTVSHLWSISVEEQFYLLWPGLAKHLNLRGLVIGASSIILVSLVATQWLSRSSTSEKIWFNTVPHLIFFGLGCLFAIVSKDWTFKKSALRSICFLIAGFLLWFAAEATTKMLDFDFKPSPFLTLGYLMVGAGCLCLLYGALCAPARIVFPPLVSLGKISYGLYIYHTFVLQGVRGLPFQVAHRGAVCDLIALPITVVIALCSYRLLERPFLKLKQRFERVATRPA